MLNENQTQDYKEELIKFIEKNIVDKVVYSKNANVSDKKQALRVKRDINNRRLNTMSIVMYYYHAIMYREDVKKSKNRRMLQTFEKSLKSFEKKLKKIGKQLEV